MTIKRIFSDMDGTLLNSEGRVSSLNSEAIRDAQIPLTLVSARAPMEMREAIEELQLTGPQVAFNGGLIYQLVEGKLSPFIQIFFLERQHRLYYKQFANIFHTLVSAIMI